MTPGLVKAVSLHHATPQGLTPRHGSDLCSPNSCLLAKTYNAAASLLEEDIFDVDPSQTCCTPTDLFLYAYYGGMLCLGERNAVALARQGLWQGNS